MTRPVAIVQSGDAFENRARILPLAIAIRDHGWDPIVLVDDIGAASLFLLHGVACVSVAALDDADRPPGIQAEPDDLCPLKLRSLEMAGQPLSDAEWREIEAASRRLWRMLEAIDPAALFVWNGFTGVWANALRVFKERRGLPGGFMERGPAADAIFVDAAGVNGGASFAGGPGGDAVVAPAAPDIAAAPEPPSLAGRLRAWLMRVATPAPPLANGRERIIFVPLQVQDDSNILLHSPRILRMRDLVGFGLELGKALGSDWRVVARPHPEERAATKLNLPRDPRLTIDSETPLERYLDRAAVCLTVNSTVGLTAALAGAVTACLGEGIYCRQPFVVNAQDRGVTETARDIARRIAASAPTTEARAFMAELDERALFRSDDAPAITAERLERCGLVRFDGEATSSAPIASVRIERPRSAHAAMLKQLEALKASTGEITVDFDFESGETLFLTYRKNREPLTRGHLAARAEALFGRPVRLARTHRAIGREGRVLMTHSRRAAEDLGGYDLVLDEFGLPHARTCLGAAQP